MKPRTFRRVTRAVPENAFQAQVLALAKLRGWRRAHFRPARVRDPRTGADTWRTPVQGDGAGFPDTILLRGDRLIAAELKTDTGPKPRPDQVAWLDAFAAAGAEAYVWRPKHWDDIEEVLR